MESGLFLLEISTQFMNDLSSSNAVKTCYILKTPVGVDSTTGM